MANPKYGYKEGVREIVYLPVKAGETWQNGDMLVLSSGYLAKAATGGKPIGVAFGDQDLTVGSNGDITAAVDVSESTLCYYPVGTGTITVAMQGKTCDIDGAASLDVTASADDNWLIVKADVANNCAWVRLRTSAVAEGVA